ncbi:MAG: AAA family ATPase [Chloroflexales bacterium]|nr:AAA family ATPase [Chloroflexales bacterium]
MAEITTRAGSFRLAIKIGLAVGPVLSAIVGDPVGRLLSALAGAARGRAATAEHHAHTGEVLLDEGLARLTPGLRCAEERDGFVVASALERRPAYAPIPPLPAPPSALQPTLEAFVHPAIVRRLAGRRAGFVNEHRGVTVLFVGFVDFDYDDDPEVHLRLQAYVAAVTRVVHQYDGDLNKVDMGDKGSKFVIVFGAPVAHEDDTIRALHCAMALRDLAPEVAGTEQRVRIGIASGLVFCGLVGAEQRREYTVMGDTANLAARLMQAAAPGQIVVASGTHRRIAEHFVWQPLDPLPLKGRSRTVTVYALERARQRASRHQEAAYKLPMVGREAEMQLIEQRMDLALRGHGQVVAIAAEAGMGKSRLVAEVIRLAARRGMAAISGDCLSHGASASYLPWHTLLRGLFGIDPGWSPEAQLRHLREQISAVDEQILARLPLLEVALNLEIGETDLTRSLDARVRKDALETTVIACVRALAGGRREGRDDLPATPLLMVVEDCHWIDPLSRDLLEVVARSIIDRPILLLLAYRPPEAGQQLLHLARMPYFTELVLREFSLRETEWLIGLKFGYLFGARGVLPVSFVERITVRSQGNPFYIDQMINYIQDQGINPGDAEALERVRLPDSLRALIISRIDRLSEQAQVTLKVASVIGCAFRASWLYAIYPPLGAPEQIHAQLDTLSRLDLTTLEKAEPELEYFFKHVVTQEVAYESLTLATRTMLHEAVGHYIEATQGDEVERYLDTLAFHYGRSNDRLKQRHYFRLAGEAAQAAYANEIALGYFRRLRPLLEPGEQIGVMLREGAVLQLVGRWPEAETTVHEALALAEAGGDEATVARCKTELANLLASRGDFDQAIAIIDAVMPVWERLDDPSGHYDALWILGYVLTEIGEYTRGLRQLEHTHEIAVRLGDQRLIAKSIGYMGVLYVDISDYEMALYCLERSAAMARQFSEWSLLVRTQSNVGFIATLQHRLDEALAIFHGLLLRAAEIGDRRSLARLAREIGRCHQLMGDVPGAMRCYALQIAIGLELGERRDMSVGMGFLASAYAQQGDDEQALRIGELAVTLCDSIRLVYWGCEFRHEIARVMTAQGRYAEAAARNAEALTVARALGTHKGVQLAATLLAARLRVLLREELPAVAVAEIAALDEDWYEDLEQAAIAYTIWRVDPSREDARQRAASLYGDLAATRPSAATVARAAELAGVLPPPLTPPPDLPEVITRRRYDLAPLIEQAEALVGSVA